MTSRWAAAVSLVRIGGARANPGIQFLLKPDGVIGRSLNDASQILTAPSTWAAHAELIEAVRELCLRDAAAQLSGNVAIYMNKSQVPAAVMKLVQDKDPAVRCVTAWYLHNGGRALELNDVLAVFQATLKLLTRGLDDRPRDSWAGSVRAPRMHYRRCPRR